MRDKLSYSAAGKLGALSSAKGAAVRKQKRIDNYSQNPKLCKFCEKIIPYDKRRNDYCSQSCSAKFINESRGFSLLQNKVFVCLFCNKDFEATSERKYCSRECMINFWWQETKASIIENGYDTSYNHHVAKRYLIELHEGKCQICNLSVWNGQPMPLVIDHINGNSEDGLLSNLRVICNNCDALTDTYKFKNKGNGRALRRQRYKEGKSY